MKSHHKMERLHSTPLLRDFCPTCRCLLDAATEAHNAEVMPRPGDYSICFRCGQCLVFNDELRHMKIELQQVDEAQRDFMNRLQGQIRARG